LLCILTIKEPAVDYTANLEDITRQTGMTFPSSVKVIDAGGTAWLDPSVFAKLEIDKEDIPKLILRLPSPRHTSRQYLQVLDILQEYPRDWAPRNAQYFTCVTARSGHWQYIVLISDDHHGRSIVYMEYFAPPG
jgi:hypothetical protein